MKAKEFNEKYKEYIEKGFEDQGLEFDNYAVTAFLDNIFQDLIKIPGFTYSQIKIKWNYSRFYTNLSSRFLIDMIESEINKLLLPNHEK